MPSTHKLPKAAFRPPSGPSSISQPQYMSCIQKGVYNHGVMVAKSCIHVYKMMPLAQLQVIPP